MELLQGHTLLEVTEVRRLFEPVATSLAATRISAEQLHAVKGHLDAMREARDDMELLNEHDAAFHRAVLAATGNRTLSTLLDGVSSQTLRARVWRGLVDDNAAGRTLAARPPRGRRFGSRGVLRCSGTPCSSGCAPTTPPTRPCWQRIPRRDGGGR